jgi:putative transposase
VFEEPFRRIGVDNDDYFVQLVYYIHANPQLHGFVEDFRVYPHSSYQTHLSKLETRLNRDALLNWFSGANAYEACHLPNQVLADLAQFEIEL